MKRSILSLLFIAAGLMSFAQETTDTEFVSDHYIVNNTSANIEVVVDKSNKKVTPIPPAQTFVIAPGEEVKVSSISWKGQFRVPNAMYIITIKNVEGIKDPNVSKNWELTKIDETHGKYVYAYDGKPQATK
ncbi:hypothetical protein [Crocinitomix catalasitica]|uniref:hypothetical protein n=1 Tax=Crocinitomix catalasitica TaxID=184607 RepID=UPI0004823ECE|nr:hypothetical protein [Crocinitomix catalasitica]